MDRLEPSGGFWPDLKRMHPTTVVFLGLAFYQRREQGAVNKWHVVLGKLEQLSENGGASIVLVSHYYATRRGQQCITLRRLTMDGSLANEDEVEIFPELNVVPVPKGTKDTPETRLNILSDFVAALTDMLDKKGVNFNNNEYDFHEFYVRR